MKLPKHRRDEAALNSRLIRRPIKRMVWLFLLSTFAAFCIGFLYPFFKGLFLSFCKFRIPASGHGRGWKTTGRPSRTPAICTHSGTRRCLLW